MHIKTDFQSFQKVCKDIKAIISKSPLAKAADDAKDLGSLLTSDTAAGALSLEMATKGFYLKSTVPGETVETGSVIIRLDSVTALKTSVKETVFSVGKGEKVLRMKSGRFRADVPVRHDTDEITKQRLNEIPVTHAIAVNKLATALGCVDLDSEETLFAKFVFGSDGLRVWSNSPSTAALYHNSKAAFEDDLEVTLPVEFLATFLSKVSGKVQLGVTESLFHVRCDDMEITHPLQDADLFDIRAVVDGLLKGADWNVRFGFKISDAIEAFTSVESFSPDDNRCTVRVDGKKNLFTCRTTSASGEGENSFPVTDPEGSSALKLVEGLVNCKTALKLLENMAKLGVDTAVCYMLPDRILFRSSDDSVTYVCAQME